MLRGSISGIRQSQFIYIILISFFVTGSTLILFYNINSLTISESGTVPQTITEEFDRAEASLMNPSFYVMNLPLIILPLVFASIIIIAYIPALSSLGISKTLINKQAQGRRSFFPFWGYTIYIGNTSIRITRKITSLKGLLLREMNFYLTLPLDYPEKKRVFDFLVGEKIKYTESHIRYQKTVDIRNIPLIIVRTRAILRDS